jgi:hypothetical protein
MNEHEVPRPDQPDPAQPAAASNPTDANVTGPSSIEPTPADPDPTIGPRRTELVAAPPRARGRRTALVAAGAVAGLLLCGGIGSAALTGADAPEPVGQRASATPNGSPSPSPSESPSSAPTSPVAVPTTEAPLPPPPSPAAPKPRVVSGRGDDVVKIPALTNLAVVVFTCPKCTSNTVLRSDGPDGLLVNEIGAYTGKRWINLEDDSLTTQFEVEANGRWTLTIGSVEQLATKAPSGSASGKGDSVLVLGGDASAVKITHRKGRSNFVVHAYSLDTGEGGLLVNEIGGYSGTRPLTTPALVQITADGNWTIAPA